jgi:ATP-dependent DNA helicase RecG
VHRFDSKPLESMEIYTDEIGLGRQIYCLSADTRICKDGFKDLMDGYERRDFPLPDYSISILHGK